MDLIWIIYSLNFIISIPTSSSSRSNHHFKALYNDGLVQLTREDPIKMAIYETEIVPWLRNHLSETEITNLNLETIDRNGQNIPNRPIFKDPKLLFELAEFLFTKGLNELGSEVLHFIRSRIFSCSTYSVLIASLNLDELIIFNQVLKHWFPTSSDVISAIVNVIHLQMGEDEAILLIDLVWNNLVESLHRDFIYTQFSYILMIAMKNHYVSVFEDILERFPNMIRFTNSRLRSSETEKNIHRRHREGAGGTIVHQFCHNLSPNLLNQYSPPDLLSDSNKESRPDSPSYNHVIRSYPTVNFDLLNVMKLHGADIEERDGSGMTPLHFAIYVKNHHIVNVLLRSGADPNGKYSRYYMGEWIKRNHDEQVEKIFEDFFQEQERNMKRETEKIRK